VDLNANARLAARIEGKSSLARLGLAVHVTAPTIHAGSKGQIQLEIINHGPLPIRLRPGMPVCQLIFEQTLGVPDRAYGGQFIRQAAS
jgi:dCTP deaminase